LLQASNTRPQCNAVEHFNTSKKQIHREDSVQEGNEEGFTTNKYALTNPEISNAVIFLTSF
jgi:hypothetical protein